MPADVFYVGAVGPGRKLSAGIYFPFDPLEAWLMTGGTEKEYKLATGAGFAWKGGTWVYEGDDSCNFSRDSGDWEVAGKSYGSREDAFKAMGDCNEKLARAESGGGSGNCCCGGGGGKKEKTTETVDTRRGPGMTGQSGVAGFGGYSDGASMVTMAPLGPWYKESPIGASPTPSGATTAETGHGDDCCCCCCCPCDPGGNTYTKGNTITSSPVEASKSAGGFVITGQPTQSGHGGHEMSQGTRAAGMTQPQITSVPGYAGPLSKLTQASSSSGCGCGCSGGQPAPAGGTMALPAIPSAMAATPKSVMDSDVFDIAPARSGTVLSRTVLAAPTDGEKFASFSRDLLADVLTVSAARPAFAGSPEVFTLASAPVRSESPATLRRTISG